MGGREQADAQSPWHGRAGRVRARSAIGAVHPGPGGHCGAQCGCPGRPGPARAAPHHGGRYAGHSKRRLKRIRPGRARRGPRARGVCVSFSAPPQPRAAPLAGLFPVVQGPGGVPKATGTGGSWPGGHTLQGRGPNRTARAPLTALCGGLSPTRRHGSGSPGRPQAQTWRRHPSGAAEGGCSSSPGRWSLQAGGVLVASTRGHREGSTEPHSAAVTGTQELLTCKGQQGRSRTAAARGRPIPASSGGRAALPGGGRAHTGPCRPHRCLPGPLGPLHLHTDTRDNLARDRRGHHGSKSPGRKAAPSPQEATAVGCTVSPQKLFFGPNPRSRGCDLICKVGFCPCNRVRVRSHGTWVALNPTRLVFL